MEDSMSTSIQSLQNNQFAQNPNPPPQQQQQQPPPPQPKPPQQDKKVTFQQPPSQMNGPNPRMPHRLPKQETQLPHPSGMTAPSVGKEVDKGLKIPPTQVKEPSNNLQEQLKDTGVVVVLSMFLFSNIVQDCFMAIIPNGSYENRATLVTSLVTSLLLGCAHFLVKKFLL